MAAMQRRMLGAVGVALVALSAACAHTSRAALAESAADAVAPSTGAMLVVRNHNFQDMDVFLVRDGVATRVGTVTGETQQQFTLDRSLFPDGAVRLVASPIGGMGTARSGQLLVSPGQTVTFTIQPDLAASMATVS